MDVIELPSESPGFLDILNLGKWSANCLIQRTGIFHTQPQNERWVAPIPAYWHLGQLRGYLQTGAGLTFRCTRFRFQLRDQGCVVVESQSEQDGAYCHKRWTTWHALNQDDRALSGELEHLNRMKRVQR
jgi:hypothetical protein